MEDISISRVTANTRNKCKTKEGKNPSDTVAAVGSYIFCLNLRVTCEKIIQTTGQLKLVFQCTFECCVLITRPS